MVFRGIVTYIHIAWWYC